LSGSQRIQEDIYPIIGQKYYNYQLTNIDGIIERKSLSRKHLKILPENYINPAAFKIFNSIIQYFVEEFCLFLIEMIK
jgi:hypothetical protein